MAASTSRSGAMSFVGFARIKLFQTCFYRNSGILTKQHRIQDAQDSFLSSHSFPSFEQPNLYSLSLKSQRGICSAVNSCWSCGSPHPVSGELYTNIYYLFVVEKTLSIVTIVESIDILFISLSFSIFYTINTT